MTIPTLLRQLADVTEKLEAVTLENSQLRTEIEAVKIISKDMTEKRWFTTAEAAKFIGRSEAFLNKDRRHTPPTIPFQRVGERKVAYEVTDLAEYVADRKKKRNGSV